MKMYLLVTLAILATGCATQGSNSRGNNDYIRMNGAYIADFHYTMNYVSGTYESPTYTNYEFAVSQMEDAVAFDPAQMMPTAGKARANEVIFDNPRGPTLFPTGNIPGVVHGFANMNEAHISFDYDCENCNHVQIILHYENIRPAP